MERELETVIPNDKDIEMFQNLERLLKKHRARLIGPEGLEDEISPEMYDAIVHFAHLLATNKIVLATPIDKDLTTQEAAIYLGVSRPTLVKLLENGEIPFTRVGKHRRVRFTDLKAYRDMKYAERQRALEELTRMSEEMGGYDVNPEDLEAFNAA